MREESKGLSAKLNDMILVSKFIIIGAYLRRESRGCHLRSDYQDTDKDFIKHFDIKYSEIDGYIKTILDLLYQKLMKNLLAKKDIKEKIKIALKEDFGRYGDITSKVLISKKQSSKHL